MKKTIAKRKLFLAPETLCQMQLARVTGGDGVTHDCFMSDSKAVGTCPR